MTTPMSDDEFITYVRKTYKINVNESYYDMLPRLRKLFLEDHIGEYTEDDYLYINMVGHYYTIVKHQNEIGLKYYMMALKNDVDGRIAFNIGSYYQNYDFNPEEMKKYYDIAISKKHYEAYINLSSYANKEKKYEEALEYIKKYNEFNPSENTIHLNTVKNNTAWCYYGLGKYEDAIAIANELLEIPEKKLNIDKKKLYYLIGVCNSLMENYDEMKRNLDLAGDCEFGYAYLLYALYFLHIEKNQDKYMEYLILAMNIGNIEAFNLLHLKNDCGEENPVEFLQKCFKDGLFNFDNPDNSDKIEKLGIEYFNLKNYDCAIKYLTISYNFGEKQSYGYLCQSYVNILKQKIFFNKKYVDGAYKFGLKEMNNHDHKFFQECASICAAKYEDTALLVHEFMEYALLFCEKLKEYIEEKGETINDDELGILYNLFGGCELLEYFYNKNIKNVYYAIDLLKIAKNKNNVEACKNLATLFNLKEIKETYDPSMAELYHLELQRMSQLTESKS